MRISEIRYVSNLADVDEENDNIDILLKLSDGRVYSFVVATPNNVFWCMENEGTDYFFAYPPPLFVSRLNEDNIERAFLALLSERSEHWLNLYGVKQRGE